MEVKPRIFLIALIITLFLLSTTLLIGSVFNNKRYAYIDAQFNKMYNNFNEMQTFFLMADTYGDKMACIAFEKRMSEMDKFLWDLGKKIDQYREASEEFQKDPYYLKQKAAFNENELYYLMMLKKLKERCSYHQAIILFFYKNAKECNKCDDQSFVLTDINKDIDKEVAIFSFDMDLNLSSLEVLAKYYNVSKYPCTVINDHPFCGMQDKNFILKRICDYEPLVSVCSRH
jgi:hypothetical protein